MEKETITYEIDYLLNPELKDEDISVFTNNLRNNLEEKGGLVVSEGTAKRLPLAYSIKKEVSAIFNWLNFVLSPKSIKEIKDFIETNSGVLRYLIIKVPKEKPAKPIVKPRPKKTETLPPKKAPATPKEQAGEVKEEEIDKKIEEILGE